MIKRFSALVLALVIAAGAMCSCSKKVNKKDTSSKDESSAASSEAADPNEETAPEVPDAKLVIDGKEMDTDGLVMCTIDGRDVDFDTFRYYYYYTVNQLTQSYGATIDTIRETEGGFDSLLENTITNIKQEYVTYHICDENGVTLSDEEIKANEDTYNNSIEQMGSDEEFQKTLKSAYLTGDVYKQMLELAALYSKCESELFTNEGVYATSKDEFRKIVKDPEKYACVRSILIPYSCKTDIPDSEAADYDAKSLSEKYSAKQMAYAGLDDDAKEAAKKEAKKVADEVIEKAKNGDDFEKLIEEYNWDPGQESMPDGYYLTPASSYVKEYLDAAFKLEEGQVSTELVENDSYGWFVIKRMPIDMEYVEANIDTMIQDYDLPSREKLYTDIMDSMEVTYADFYDKLTIDSIT
ncbi:MAG: peptidyl-prolyl cis-trans isomerase [Ruminococcus sp.]|nr:peptidyl-prolyl cis-trans isomerase [Ruminococcus sp.]